MLEPIELFIENVCLSSDSPHPRPLPHFTAHIPRPARCRATRRCCATWPSGSYPTRRFCVPRQHPTPRRRPSTQHRLRRASSRRSAWPPTRCSQPEDSSIYTFPLSILTFPTPAPLQLLTFIDEVLGKYLQVTREHLQAAVEAAMPVDVLVSALELLCSGCVGWGGGGG